MTWFRRRRTPTEQPERLSVSEAIIISKSGNTEESWARLTPQQRADIRWRLGA